MSEIDRVSARPILDSRGEWTIEVALELKNGAGVIASVPQGKSRGAFEAISLNPARAARNVVKIISPALRGIRPDNQKRIDSILTKLDGTADKSRLGANAILGVSLACARAAAHLKAAPLWVYLREVCGGKTKKGFPALYVNVINGGLHGGNNLDFQEYMAIIGAGSLKDSVKIAADFYGRLGEYLKKNFPPAAVNVGDEGGFACDFRDNLAPFEVLSRVRRGLGLAKRVGFGLDAAASGLRIKPKELFAVYEKMKKKFNVAYIEDPFGERDFKNFTLLKKKLGRGTVVAGDDLTVTNVGRMKKAASAGSVSGVIIKPNQIGTLSETLEAVKFARSKGWVVIVSHRSGETNDDFIADLAVGVGADGIKLGAPARGERVAKYNRLLEIDEEMSYFS